MSLYGRFKKWVYDTIHPDASDTFAANVFDCIIMTLIILSVAIVFAVTFDLPQEVMDVCRKAERVIVIVFVSAPWQS